ncbi:MAG: four helix bundle protein [Phycisphaerae bacterium]|jgi:four helix bundle protein
MAGIRSYRDLLVWQRGCDLVKLAYELTKTFPREELYGLVQQLRRAAVSVPSNVAEGYGRGTRKDYIHFLQTARGSLYEVETQVILAQKLGYATDSQARPLSQLIEESSRLLHGLILSLQRNAQDKGNTERSR